ncbi:MULTISPECIES: fluoride efflux transporter CrcB [Arsenophonus]|uniref:Fluoride-specific ion channel FluC n=1 Tax=Arsenophonus apicola TaxID=2879119 RepID=A0ABY8P0H7_9GAMM|nr:MULTISPECIES: fluoride efflux transporter CrcB [Arsenophonus]WGL98949.1 fluoride efflux transporter CrcB [Arsenophonus sp. aPb]WGO82982.1 fluoride efflux transporter CrcB [Arsenophonus apicola]
MIKIFLAISIGSALGGISRWLLSTKLNPLIALLPLGTYLSNVIASFILGIAFAYFANHYTLSPEWRLMVMTGFCGGLSTFSTFSLEVMLSFQQQRYYHGFLEILIHVVSTLLVTYFGMLVYQLIQNR